ncbi:hypothetical protein BJ741DRAFT_712523 [Chytriomyces cf. hyalinus JEL632]|nr:hypothetical protein BJ741DRAFT_712523 [Chytriomyces cf. hyalinus JEL632]
MSCSSLSASAPLPDQPPASHAIKRKLSQPETQPSKHSSLSKGKPPLTCDVCLKEFTKNAKLQQHLMSHSGERPFKCNFEGCTKAYSRKSHLDSEYDHEGEEEEAEEEEEDLDDSKSCKSCASSVSRLDRGGSEAGGRCDARFSSFYHLQRHLKAHTDPLPHKSLQAGCNMFFAKQVQLKKHDSVQLEDRPVFISTVPACGKAFMTIPEQSLIVPAPVHEPSVDEKLANERNDSIDGITNLVGHTFRTDH